LSDFHVIGGFNPWVYQENYNIVKWLTNELHNGDVLITHHLPSYKCVQPPYVGDSLNRFFVTELEQLILDKEPKLALHGHSHITCDTYIGNTHILSNPFGYLGENKQFKEDLVIEI
jgi:Icc-related predicted phosphoesterase